MGLMEILVNKNIFFCLFLNYTFILNLYFMLYLLEKIGHYISHNIENHTILISIITIFNILFSTQTKTNTIKCLNTRNKINRSHFLPHFQNHDDNDDHTDDNSHY